MNFQRLCRVMRLACAIVLFTHTAANCQQVPFETGRYNSPPDLVATDVPTSAIQSEGAIDLASRLADLEAHAQETESKLKSLQDSPKKSEVEKKKLPSIQINGAVQVDAVMFGQNDASREVYGHIQNGADFRRARLGAKGAISDRMDYFFQMDFGFFGRPTFTDLWVDFKEAGPLGTIRVGQWKQPFSLEVVSSYRYTTFMERAGTFQAFTPFRHIGVGFYDHSSDLNSTWAFSYHRTGQDQYGGSLSADGGNGIASRLTHLAWYDEECGDRYLHLGLAYFLNAPPLGLYRSRSIPEIFVGEYVRDPDPLGSSGVAVPTLVEGTPFFVDTGILREVSVINTYGSESLWVQGPLSWQSEVMGQHIDSASISNALLWGGYTQVGFFLTGEHRPYDRKAGAIDRVMPLRSLNKKRDGWGALEIAARWSYLDLIDRDVRGGTMDNVTLGLNWFVNPYCKVVFNYIQSNSESRKIRNGIVLGADLIEARSDAYGLRCQFDF